MAHTADLFQLAQAEYGALIRLIQKRGFEVVEDEVEEEGAFVITGKAVPGVRLFLLLDFEGADQIAIGTYPGSKADAGMLEVVLNCAREAGAQSLA